MPHKDDLTPLIFDLSQIIVRRQRELLYAINPDLIKLLSEVDKAVSQLEFKARLEQHSTDKMSWLNTNLNLALWELGKRINEEPLPDRGAATYNIWIQMVEKHGNIWDEADVHTLARFAEIFPDRNMALGIATLVKWAYFPVLFTLLEPEAIFFYARLAATRGLSLLDLQTQIDNKAYEKTSGAKAREQNAINQLQNPRTTTETTKKGNMIVVAETVWIADDDISANPDVINIFLNPSLFFLAPATF